MLASIWKDIWAHFIPRPFLNLAIFIVLTLLNQFLVLDPNKPIWLSLLFRMNILSLFGIAYSFISIHVSTPVKTPYLKWHFFTNSTLILSLLLLSFYDAGTPINFSCFTMILPVIQSSLPFIESSFQRCIT